MEDYFSVGPSHPVGAGSGSNRTLPDLYRHVGFMKGANP